MTDISLPMLYFKDMKRKNDNSELVTKGFLKSELEFKLSDLEQRVDDKAQGYRDEILTSNDKLAKTLEAIREDLEIGSFQTRNQVEDHEKTIKHLEKIPQTV